LYFWLINQPSKMIEKLEAIKARSQEVVTLLAQPDTMADRKQYTALSKEYKGLSKLVHCYNQYKKVLADAESAKAVLHTEKDVDFREMAKEELEILEQQKQTLEERIKMMLIPKDPNDSKNIILEIRAGAGGDEAAIFAGDLFRMYKRFSEKMNWTLHLLDMTEGTAGGYKELICTVAGEEVYGMMKYESGVHRVQRVPATETQGRTHTSAASVVVLPERGEVEVDIDMNDIRKDTFCSSGPGGQSVNTTYSAIRLTHLPTGLVVSCQDGKSQLKNLEKALKVLRARLYERELKKQQAAVGAERKSIVKSGDRSDKIRTYNYPQGRVTDHRINYTAHNLPVVMDGEIGSMIEALRIADNAEKLKTGK
jgi:peptide chain release factor 1